MLAYISVVNIETGSIFFVLNSVREKYFSYFIIFFGTKYFPAKLLYSYKVPMKYFRIFHAPDIISYR